MEIEDLERTSRKAQLAIESKIEREINKLKKDEISNSINHLEISLEKYLKAGADIEIDNVYYHIGAIKAAIK